jgi:hypothetical protein
MRDTVHLRRYACATDTVRVCRLRSCNGHRLMGES